MKTKNILFAFILVFLSNLHSAHAALIDDSNTIFNWAEEQHSQYFSPAGQSTQTLDIWYYRFYPSTGIYIGVNNQSDVYLLGGEFGDIPQKVYSVSELLAIINSTSSGNTTANNNPGNGNCVNLSFPIAGLQATYNTTSSDGSLSMTTTYTNTNNTSATSTVSSNVSTSSFSSSSSTTTTQNYQITDDYLLVNSVNTTISSSVPGLGSFDEKTTTTFSPAHNEGPALKYCEQQSWTADSVSQTTTTENTSIPGGNNSSNTEVVTGVVEAVNESLSTAAGTFNTVKVRETIAGEDTITWFSTEHGIFVKVQVLNSAGTVVSETEASSIN